MISVAIIGAGISGITLACNLPKNYNIQIFEKARGVGGRMATRYAGDYKFDHGTQYFCAETREFQNFLDPYIDKKIVAEWKGKVACFEGQNFILRDHFVACPGMNSLCKELAKDLNITLNCQVKPLSTRNKFGKWELYNINDEFLGEFDWVISTAPAQQSLDLFTNFAKIYDDSNVMMQSCYAVMLGFQQAKCNTAKCNTDFIAYKTKKRELGAKFIAFCSTKPQRDNNFHSVVIHSTKDFAAEYKDSGMEKEQVGGILINKITNVLDLHDYQFKATHLWRYATVEKAKPEFFIDFHLGLAALGDWTATSKIENLWLQALRFAEYI